jgi:uncharacterized phage protein (TIGR01671 family)
MREIRFRGKRRDGGWDYGFLSVGRDGYEIVNTDGMGLFFHCPVDPSTVGQYTGLKDRNGRDIYEGDVVRLDDGDTSTFSEVFFDGGALCICSSGFTYEYDVIAIGWTNENLGVEVEVIGNIHDNPELLAKTVAEAKEGEK